METDQLFLMDCYIKTIKVYYNKLPFYDSDKWWSRTYVNFNLFEHSKLEVQESEFSAKRPESSLVLNKGASCLFGLRDEQLLELCRNLGVTVIVSDEIKGTNEKVTLASKNMVLPLSSSDLIHGMGQDSSTNETRVNEFFMCDKLGQVVVHMSGYLRVTFLGRRVVTHFYFSKTLNDILYRTAGQGENGEQSKVSQVEAIQQITENLKSQQKEPADIEIWKVDPKFDVSKTKAAEKACLDSLRGKTKEETRSLEEYPQQKDGLFDRETTPAKDSNLAAGLLLLEEAVRGAKIAEQLKIDGIVRQKADSKDQLEVKCICPFINFTKKTDNLEAKELLNAFTRGQCVTCVTDTSPTPSQKASSNEDTSVKNGTGASQRHGSMETPCPCLMADQLIRFLSCPCMNKESKSLQSIESTQVSDLLAAEMAKASGEHKKEKSKKGIIIIKPGSESCSCTCMNNKAKNSDPTDTSVKNLETKLFSCECVAEQIDKVAKPMAFLANLLSKIPTEKENKSNFVPAIHPYIVYSCTCMVNKHLNPRQQNNNCPNQCMHARHAHDQQPLCPGQRRMHANGPAQANPGQSHNACNAHMVHNAHNAHNVYNAHNAHHGHNPQHNQHVHNNNTDILGVDWEQPSGGTKRECPESTKRVVEAFRGPQQIETNDGTTNVESKIKQLLSDEYNIFIADTPDSILPSNPMRRAEIERIKGGGGTNSPTITETFFPVPMTDTPEAERREQPTRESQFPLLDTHHPPGFEHQNNPPSSEVRNVKRQVPVIEVPYDGTQDVFLLKIKLPKQEGNQTDKKADQYPRQAENVKKHDRGFFKCNKR